MADLRFDLEIENNGSIKALNEVADTIDDLADSFDQFNDSFDMFDHFDHIADSVVAADNALAAMVGTVSENVSYQKDLTNNMERTVDLANAAASAIKDIEKPLKELKNTSEQLDLFGDSVDSVDLLVDKTESLLKTYEKQADLREHSYKKLKKFEDVITGVDKQTKSLTKQQKAYYETLAKSVNATNALVHSTSDLNDLINNNAAVTNSVEVAKKLAHEHDYWLQVTDAVVNHTEVLQIGFDKMGNFAVPLEMVSQTFSEMEENLSIVNETMRKSVEHFDRFGENAQQAMLYLQDAPVEKISYLAENMKKLEESSKSWKTTWQDLHTSIQPIVDIKNTDVDKLQKFQKYLDKSTESASETASEVDNIGTASGGILSRVARVTTEFGGWGAAIVVANNALSLVQQAVGAITSRMSSFTTVARENMASHVRLAQVINNVASYSDDTRAIFEDLTNHAREFSQATGIGETELQAGLYTLSAFTQDLETSKNLMESLANLAMGLSPNMTVSVDKMQKYGQAIAEAVAGGTGMHLRRLPVAFSDAESELFKLADTATRTQMIIDGIERQFGGLANAMGQTPTGVIDRANNAMGDFKDSIGRTALAFQASFKSVFLAFAPAIQQGLDRLLAGIKTAIINNMDTIRTVISSAFGVFFTVKRIVKNVFGVIPQVVGAAINFVQTLFGNVTTSISENLSTIVSRFKTLGIVVGAVVIPKIVIAVQKLIAQMLLKIKVAMLSATKWLVAWALKLKPITLIIAAIGLLRKAVVHFADDSGTAMDFVKGLFFDLLDLVLAVVNGAINAFLGLANFLAGVFRDPVGAVIDLFRTLGTSILWILEPITSILDRILGTSLSSGIASLRNGLNTWADNKLAARGYEP
ncbi:MAG: taxilin, partial [Firmicutes bacterium]|nr:taxilin [Bacillota bacterium]